MRTRLFKICFRLGGRGANRLEHDAAVRIRRPYAIAITPSVPLFETSLAAATHCDPGILTFMEAPVPAEIDGDSWVGLM